MPSDPVPFLWLCGPSGVGKSSVGWEIFTQLSRAGVRTGYVDADQLGLCYPAPADDPDTHRVKSRNLGAVWSGFRAAGVRCLILSGSVDTADAVRAYADSVPGTALTLCRLRAGDDVLRERFRRRGWQTHRADEAVEEAAALDRTDFADVHVGTDALSVPEVARLVRERTGGWPRLTDGPADPAPAARPAPATPSARPVGERPVPLLWLCGPVGVGKSTVGYEVFSQVVRSGVRAAYVDLAQIGFCRPADADDPDNHRLKAGNLGAMWPTLRAAGARCLIVTGRVNDHAVVRTYADAVGGASLRLCRLHAGRDALTARILRRGRGEGTVLPADELNGLPADDLYRLAGQAADDADRLDRAGIGDLRVDTDGRSVEEVARLVGWPDLT